MQPPFSHHISFSSAFCVSILRPTRAKIDFVRPAGVVKMVSSCTVGLTVALLAFTAVEAGVLPRYRNGYTPPVRSYL